LKRITIHDIARELDITFSTVARALNDHPAISERTKKEVLKTAKKLGYQQNKLASSLRSGKTNIIGIIVPSLKVNFFSSVVAGIEEIMNKNGYSILFYQSNENLIHEKKGIETFIQARVDGIIASVTKETLISGHFKEILDREIPLVFFDRVLGDLHTPNVTINDFKGAYEATEHLIKQGYKHIVHINGIQRIPIFEERLRGYIAALEDNNIKVDKKLIIKGKFSKEFGAAVIRKLIKKKINFDAVFALEDFTAMGVLTELKKHKIKIPEEVGVIGFANEPFSELVSPQLSTIDQQTKKMGEATGELMLLSIKQKNKKNQVPLNNIVLDPVLLVRESTSKNSK
jgi:LacI family transcriptional regulator